MSILDIQQVDKEIEEFLLKAPEEHIKIMRTSEVYCGPSELAKLREIAVQKGYDIHIYTKTDNGIYAPYDSPPDSIESQSKKIHLLYHEEHYTTLTVNGKYFTSDIESSLPNGEVKTIGDGNCLFNSYIQALEQKPSYTDEEYNELKNKADLLRLNICDMLQKEWESCKDKTLEDLKKNNIYRLYWLMIQDSTTLNENFIKNCSLSQAKRLKDKILELTQKRIVALYKSIKDPRVTIDKSQSIKGNKNEVIFEMDNCLSAHFKNSKQFKYTGDKQVVSRNSKKSLIKMINNSTLELLVADQIEQRSALIDSFHALIKEREKNGTKEPLFIEIDKLDEKYLRELCIELQKLKLPIKFIQPKDKLKLQKEDNGKIIEEHNSKITEAYPSFSNAASTGVFFSAGVTLNKDIPEDTLFSSDPLTKSDFAAKTKRFTR